MVTSRYIPGYSSVGKLSPWGTLFSPIGGAPEFTYSFTQWDLAVCLWEFSYGRLSPPPNAELLPVYVFIRPGLCNPLVTWRCQASPAWFIAGVQQPSSNSISGVGWSKECNYRKRGIFLDWKYRQREASLARWRAGQCFVLTWKPGSKWTSTTPHKDPSVGPLICHNFGSGSLENRLWRQQCQVLKEPWWVFLDWAEFCCRGRIPLRSATIAFFIEWWVATRWWQVYFSTKIQIIDVRWQRAMIDSGAI